MGAPAQTNGQSNPDPWGAPAPAPYGASAPYGGPAPAPAYGAPAPSPSYAAPAPVTPAYGAPAPAPNAFAAPPASYGAPAPEQGFGQQQQYPPQQNYGQQPAPAPAPPQQDPTPFGSPPPGPVRSVSGWGADYTPGTQTSSIGFASPQGGYGNNDQSYAENGTGSHFGEEPAPAPEPAPVQSEPAMMSMNSLSGQPQSLVSGVTANGDKSMADQAYAKLVNMDAFDLMKGKKDQHRANPFDMSDSKVNNTASLSDMKSQSATVSQETVFPFWIAVQLILTPSLRFCHNRHQRRK